MFQPQPGSVSGFRPQYMQVPPHNFPYTQMPLEAVQPSLGPAQQAPGWPQPFNEAELKVAGIMPYSYGMPRYGQVSALRMTSVQPGSRYTRTPS